MQKVQLGPSCRSSHAALPLDDQLVFARAEMLELQHIARVHRLCQSMACCCRCLLLVLARKAPRKSAPEESCLEKAGSPRSPESSGHAAWSPGLVYSTTIATVTPRRAHESKGLAPVPGPGGGGGAGNAANCATGGAAPGIRTGMPAGGIAAGNAAGKAPAG